MSWLRYAVRTGSSPESGSSNRTICGSSTSARARPARLRMPPEISPGSLCSAPIRPTMSSFSATIAPDLATRTCGCARAAGRPRCRRCSSSRTARRPGTARRTACAPRTARARAAGAGPGRRSRSSRGPGASRPTSVLRNTDLPVPDGPSSTEISPAGRVRLTSDQTGCRPKDLVSPSTRTSTPTRAPSVVRRSDIARGGPVLHETFARSRSRVQCSAQADKVRGSTCGAAVGDRRRCRCHDRRDRARRARRPRRAPTRPPPCSPRCAPVWSATAGPGSGRSAARTPPPTTSPRRSASRVLRALPRYRDQGVPFSAFVYGIAAHKVADAQRAAVRGTRRRAADRRRCPTSPTRRPAPSSRPLATDQARRLVRAARPAPRHRSGRSWCCGSRSGSPPRRSATSLGMTAAAVRVAQSRALARLRALADDLREVAAARSEPTRAWTRTART